MLCIWYNLFIEVLVSLCQKRKDSMAVGDDDSSKTNLFDEESTSSHAIEAAWIEISFYWRFLE